MSNYIKVNHSQFETTANEIETYIANHEKNMKEADREVTTLASSWEGSDSKQFQIQWDNVVAYDSTSKNMVKALENYAKFLRFAASQYKEAQSKAVNKANWL